MTAVMKEPQISRPVAQFIGSPKKLLIDGKWLPAVSEATFEVKNPASGATIARAAEGDKLDVDAAVRAARRAFESGPWPAMTPSERSKIVWRIGDLISKYTADRKSTRLNSSHGYISYAVFCLKKKKNILHRLFHHVSSALLHRLLGLLRQVHTLLLTHQCIL